MIRLFKLPQPGLGSRFLRCTITTLKYTLNGLKLLLEWLRTVITHFISKLLLLLGLQMALVWYGGMDWTQRSPEAATILGMAIVVAFIGAAAWDDLV